MKSNVFKAAAAVILAVILVSASFASNGTQIGTVGAKSTAMGSNFRGLANDWSAMYYNPAGLTQLGKWTFGGSIGLIMPRGSYTADAYPVLPFTGMYTDKRDVTPTNFYVPALGIFYKPTEKMTVGVGVFAPFGLGTEWDLLTVPAGYGNANALSKEKEHFSDHMVISVQPTLAYKISDKISVGLGVSYIWGKMTIDQVKLLPNPVLGFVGYPAPLGNFPGLLNGDQTRVIIENNLEGDGSTFGANLGFLFKITDKFSIGLSGRYMMDLKLKGTMNQTIAGMNIPVIYGTLNAIPAATLGLTEAEKAQLVAMYAEGNTSVKNDVEAELPLPMTLGLGIAYKPFSKLTLTADASYTDWKSWDEILVTINGTEETVSMRENWSNTWEFGGGLEFLALDKGASQLFVRAGYYTVDTPVPDETMNPTILDPNRRHIITGGLGLNLGKLSFNLAGEYVLFGDKTVSDYEFDDRGIAENYAGLYQFKATVITFETVFHLN